MYDLKDKVAFNYEYNYLEWSSVAPETIGESIYTEVCYATAPKFRSDK